MLRQQGCPPAASPALSRWAAACCPLRPECHTGPLCGCGGCWRAAVPAAGQHSGVGSACLADTRYCCSTATASTPLPSELAMLVPPPPSPTVSTAGWPPSAGALPGPAAAASAAAAAARASRSSLCFWQSAAIHWRRLSARRCCASRRAASCALSCCRRSLQAEEKEWPCGDSKMKQLLLPGKHAGMGMRKCTDDVPALTGSR